MINFKNCLTMKKLKLEKFKVAKLNHLNNIRGGTNTAIGGDEGIGDEQTTDTEMDCNNTTIGAGGGDDGTDTNGGQKTVCKKTSDIIIKN